MKRLSRTVTALSEFEDSQAAFYLLRVSYSIVRAVHFMRTTPLEHWRDHAKKLRQADAQGGGDHPRHSLARTLVQTVLSHPQARRHGHAESRRAR